MGAKEQGTKVRILDKEYRVNCSPDNEAHLFEAASYLDRQMRAIRQSGKVIGVDKVAIMAALNISNELATLKRSPSEEVENLRERLQNLQNKIDGVISETDLNRDKLVEAKDEELESEYDSFYEKEV